MVVVDAVLGRELVDDDLADEVDQLGTRLGTRLQRSPVQRQPGAGTSATATRRDVGREHDALVRIAGRRWEVRRDVDDRDLHGGEEVEQLVGQRADRVFDETLEAWTVARAVPVDGPSPGIGVGPPMAAVAVVVHRGSVRPAPGRPSGISVSR